MKQNKRSVLKLTYQLAFNSFMADDSSLFNISAVIANLVYDL